ncbi:autotransporter outer membrane beta-barrel domain-containing protein [Bradyrhizobium sp. NAS80.1]|uniref:autotransporter outer membrane beta-barrel domain-containing protein n=1 Tax=Bradyrhizobium sp. NAS80.1 TaxID=1680159 RepID=UPI0026993BDA
MTTAGAFTLANPELRGGAFDYRLFHGGVDGSNPENWYLRSTFVVGPQPPEPPGPLPPTPPTPGPGTFPIIGPELATYGVVQPIAQQLGRGMLGTHDERMGALYYQAGVPCQPAQQPVYTKAPPLYTKAPPTDCGPEGWRPAVWGRAFGQQIDNHYQAFADPRADGRLAGFQVGFDVLRSDSLISGHKDYGGLYFAYGNANVDVTGLVTNPSATAYVLQHTGGLNLNAYSGGAYWTHYGPQGWYLDLVLQGTSYGGSASTEFARLDTTGSGFISSLEGGYPIALPMLGPGFVLEPQAQVLWQWVSFDSGFDGLGPVALARPQARPRGSD